MWRNTLARIELNADFRYKFNKVTGDKIPYIDLGLLADYKIQTLNKNNSHLEFGFITGFGWEFRTKKNHIIDLGLRLRFIEGDGDYRNF